MKKIRVTIWNEYRHEKTDENVKAIYPNGLHATIKEMLSFDGDLDITLAALDDPDQGVSDDQWKKGQIPERADDAKQCGKDHKNKVKIG